VKQASACHDSDNPEGGNVTIKWTKTKMGTTGEGSTKRCTYRFVIQPSRFGFHRYAIASAVTNTATGEVIHEGHLGGASTVAQCKATAAWTMKVGGPRLDARIEGGTA